MVKVCKFVLGIFLVVLVHNVHKIDCESGKNEELNKSNKKILQIKNVPGYPGTRSDVYEILMPPYYFLIAKKGVAELKNDKDSMIEGKIMFQQLPEGLKINGTITGLSSGVYKLYINEKGTISSGCKSSGDIYNPYKVKENQDDDPLKDISDLGEIKVEDKTTEINLMSKYLTLTGANGVIGRTVVVEKEDDSFLACGIIGVA